MVCVGSPSTIKSGKVTRRHHPLTHNKPHHYQKKPNLDDIKTKYPCQKIPVQRPKCPTALAIPQKDPRRWGITRETSPAASLGE